MNQYSWEKQGHPVAAPQMGVGGQLGNACLGQEHSIPCPWKLPGPPFPSQVAQSSPGRSGSLVKPGAGCRAKHPSPAPPLTLLTGYCSTGCHASEPARLRSAAICPSPQGCHTRNQPRGMGLGGHIIRVEVETTKGVIYPLPVLVPSGIRPPGFKSQSPIYQLHDFGPQFSHLTWENKPTS